MNAQSAVEYLMTYGWSILIIAVVIASLIELGVFNSTNSGTSACIGTTGYSCGTPILYASGALITNLGQWNISCVCSSDWSCILITGVIDVTVEFLVHAVPDMVIGPVLTCPKLVISAPDAYRIGVPQLYPVVPMQALVEVLAELNTPSSISDAITTAMISNDHP